jgi:hypothetical protein
MSSTAVWAGVRLRSPQFWSQALTSQSVASAAGWEPPITNPKNRPLGMAVSPGVQASASSCTTTAGSLGASGRSGPSRSTTSAAVAWGGTGRSVRESSQADAARCATSRAAARSGMAQYVVAVVP